MVVVDKAYNKQVPLVPWIAAWLVFSAGFVTMGLWSLFLDVPPTLPTFQDYLSGTLGDALLLPALVYGLFSTLYSLPASRSGRRWVTIFLGTIAGLALGAFSQAAWYADPDPKQNWMLPSPHEFSAVGWYHAVFLTLISGVIGGALCAILVGFRAAQRQADQGRLPCVQRMLGSNGAALIAVAAFLFVATIVVDSAQTYESLTTDGRLIILGVGVLLSAILLVLTLGHSVSKLAGPLTIAVVAALGLVEGALGPSRGQSEFLILVGASVSVGVALSFLSYRGGTIIASTNLRYSSFPILAALVAVAAARVPFEAWPIVVLLLVSVAFLSPFVILWRPHLSVAILATTIAMMVLGTVALVVVLRSYDGIQETELSLTNGLISLLIPAGIGAYLNAGVRRFWMPLVHAEREPRSDRNRYSVYRRLEVTRLRVWVLSIGLGIGAFLSVTSLVLLSVANTVRATGDGSIDLAPAVLVVFWVVIAVLLTGQERKVLFKKVSRINDMPVGRRPLRRYGDAWVMLFLLMGGILSTWLAIRTGWHGYASVLAGAVIVFLCADTIETTLVNNTLLCMSSAKRFDVIAALAVGWITSGVTYWSIFVGVDSGGLPLGFAVLALLLAVLARVAIALAVGSLIYSRKSKWYGTDQPPGWHPVQDESVRAVLLVTTAWLPIFAFTHSRAGDALVNMIVVGGGVLFLAVPLLPWACQNVLRFFDSQCEVRFDGRFATASGPSSLWLLRCAELIQIYYQRRLRPPVDQPERRFLAALGAHLSLQVLIRCAFVAVTVVGPIVAIVTGLLLTILPHEETALEYEDVID